MFDLLRFTDVNLIWLLIISIVLLILFAFLFDKGKVGKAFLGILRVIGFIFSSPIIYLKKCFINLGEVGEKHSDDIGNNQYLLNKLLLILEVVLILISVIYLSHGVITSWNGFLPPQYLRDQISQTEKYINDSNTQLDSINTILKNYDDSWVQQKDKLISDFKMQQQNKLNTASNNNAQIERQYGSIPLFTTLKNYLIQNSNVVDTYTLNQINQSATTWLNSNVSDMNLRNALFNYLSNWFMIKEVNNASNNFSEAQLRNKIQPDFAGDQSQVSYLTSNIQNSTQDLVSLRQQAKYDFGFLIENLILTLLTFLLYIWIIGLIIELMFLSVDLASNVKKIRTYMENK